MVGIAPSRLETYDLRDVDGHVDEGAAVRGEVGGHEVSKPRVMVVSWSAERIGPRIIAVPQRGHAHVATVGGSVAVDGVATVGRAALRSVRARGTRGVDRWWRDSPTAESGR